MEERVAEGILRAMFTRRFSMFQLFCLELGDMGRELGIVVTQRRKLLGIMAIDFGFDCVRAGHRSSFADERSCRAERKASHTPEGLERRRTNPSLSHQLVEPIEVPMFLGRHSRDLMGGRAASPKNCQLAGVYAGGPIFACLVNAQHRRPVGPTFSGPPAAGHAFFLASKAITAAPPRERTAFQAAMERPRNDHWTWSQRIKGTLKMSCRLAAPVAVQ